MLAGTWGCQCPGEAWGFSGVTTDLQATGICSGETRCFGGWILWHTPLRSLPSLHFQVFRNFPTQLVTLTVLRIFNILIRFVLGLLQTSDAFTVWMGPVRTYFSCILFPSIKLKSFSDLSLAQICMLRIDVWLSMHPQGQEYFFKPYKAEETFPLGGTTTWGTRRANNYW